MMDKSRSTLVVLVLMLAAAAASLFGALLVGTFPISALQVIDSLAFPAPGVVHDVIWRLRAPWAATVFACGGLFALVATLLLPPAGMRRAEVLVLAFLFGGSVATVIDTTMRWLTAGSYRLL